MRSETITEMPPVISISLHFRLEYGRVTEIQNYRLLLVARYYILYSAMPMRTSNHITHLTSICTCNHTMDVMDAVYVLVQRSNVG